MLLTKSVKRDLQIVLLLFLLSCIFFWKILAYPDKMIFTEYFSDVISYHSSPRYFISETWEEYGKLPLWNPYAFMGHPFAADPEISMFYPTNFLYLVFTTDLLFGYIFLLDIFLIGLFIYFFVRTLGLDRFSSLLSASTFMFCGTVIAHVYAGHMGNLDIMMLITASFLFLELTIKKRSFFYGILTGIFIGLQFMAGNPQISIYGSLGLFLYFLLRSFFITKNKRDFRELIKIALPLFLALIVALSLSAVQTLPTLELSKYSFRADRVTYATATSYSLPPQQLITFMMPEIFGTPLDDSYWGGRNFWELSIYLGIFSLILTIIAFITGFNNYKTIFAILLLFSLLFAFGRYFFVFPFFYYFAPFFDMFIKPSVMLFLTTFSISVLSGFGFSYLSKKTKQINKQKIWTLVKILSIIIIFAGLIWFFASLEKEFLLTTGRDMLEKKYYTFTETEHPLRHEIDYYMEKIPVAYSHLLNSLVVFIVLSSSATILLAARLTEKISIKKFKVIALIIILFDLWFFGSNYINVEDPEKIFAERIPMEFLESDTSKFRVVDLTSSLPPFISMRYQIESINGNGAGQLKSYRDFINFFFGKINGGIEPFIPLESEKIFNNSKVLGLLNVKYILTEETIDSENFNLKFNLSSSVYDIYLPTPDTKEVYIYENKDFLPRAFVVHNAKAITEEKVFDEIADENFNPQNSVILDDGIDITLNNPGEFQEAKIIYYSPDEIVVEINLQSSGFLVLSENYYPGWKAIDNDRETEIYRTNYILRSVYLDAGQHTVKFIYDPRSFRTGALITTITVLSLSVLLFVLILRRVKMKTETRTRIKERQKEANNIKLCLLCSAGGHLTEMLHLKGCYSKFPHFFITFKRVDTSELSKKKKVYFVTDPGRNPINFLKNIFESFRVLLKEKPDVIISTGAGIAVPSCYLAKFFFGSKIVFVESFCRIEKPSLSGKFMYPISDLFLVQWPEMLDKYGDKAIYRGAIV